MSNPKPWCRSATARRTAAFLNRNEAPARANGVARIEHLARAFSPSPPARGGGGGGGGGVGGRAQRVDPQAARLAIRLRLPPPPAPPPASGTGENGAHPHRAV